MIKGVVRCLLLTLVLLLSTTMAAWAATYQEGDEGQEVVMLQTRLSELGYSVGKVDGDFGNNTVAAVKAFQRDRGLEADGVVGAETYHALLGREMPASRDASSATIRRVIKTALQYTGVPYSFGGTTPNGFDCSGYVRYVFARSGISLPRAADEQYEVGRAVSYANLRPGDLVFFSTYTYGASHSGIYLGDGEFISATSSNGVVVRSMDDGYWGARYIGARRVL